MPNRLSPKRLEEIKKARASYFPEEPGELSEEDRALEMLLSGVRLVRRTSKPHIPLPLMLYGPGIKFYFEWLAKEIVENANQEAAQRLYYLAYFAVRFLGEASLKRINFFRPIARQQLFWPSVIGRGADFDRTNGKLMDYLNLGRNAPLNTARKGRKSFSIDNPETNIAFNLWCAVEFFRREAQEISSFKPVCSLVMPDLPGIRDVSRLGLSPEGEKELKTLRPLSRNNYGKWWRISEPVFMKRFGKNFQNNKLFARHRKNAVFKDDPAAAAKVRSAIKKQIKLGFRSIAPKLSGVG